MNICKQLKYECGKQKMIFQESYLQMNSCKLWGIIDLGEGHILVHVLIFLLLF